ETGCASYGYERDTGDRTGPQRDNLTLSWLREEAARRYLSQRTHVLNRLTFIGLGEEMAGGEKGQQARSGAERRKPALAPRPLAQRSVPVDTRVTRWSSARWERAKESSA